MAVWQIKQKLDKPETIHKLEQAFALDCSIPEACLYADICKQSYYNLLKDRPELIDRFDSLRNKPVLLARQEVIKWMKDNPELALKYLERKRKDEFSLKTENDTNLFVKEIKIKLPWEEELTDENNNI